MGLYSWSQWSHSISVSASYMAASPTNDPNQAHGKANGDTSRATASRQFELAKCLNNRVLTYTGWPEILVIAISAACGDCHGTSAECSLSSFERLGR